MVQPRLPLNNGLLHEAQGVFSELSNCSYFFRGDGLENYIRGCSGGSTVVACKITEKGGRTDLYISIPPNIDCNHYFRTRVTLSSCSSDDSHLTYHGRRTGKKESGEIHLVVGGRNVLKSRANVLEAPLAHSDDLAVFPLPVCRLELAESIKSITPSVDIDNYFELSGSQCFFNTLDMYLARSGFMASLLNGGASIPNIVASVFAWTTLEIFKTGTLIRRRGRFPQVLVLQTRNYELVIFAMQEAQHVRYDKSSLCYFHSRNYLKELFNRFAMGHGGGYFIDSNQNHSSVKPGFFKILDVL